MCDHLRRRALAGTCTLILGRRFGFLDGDVSETATRLADSVTSQFRASQEAFYGLPLWKLISTQAYRDFVASEDTLYEQVQLLNNAVNTNVRRTNVPNLIRFSFYFIITVLFPKSWTRP